MTDFTVFFDKRKIVLTQKKVEFGQMPPQAFLLGLLSAFDNRFQAAADRYFKEITWKQFFAIICINLCKEPPTLNNLSEIMGSSHQNVKQILLKLEHKGFVSMITDKKDKRKQRYFVTDKCRSFLEENDNQSNLLKKFISWNLIIVFFLIQIIYSIVLGYLGMCKPD